MIQLVTVSRQYGSGAADLARLVGEQLGWPVLDQALEETVSRMLGAPAEDVRAMDERADSALERFAAIFGLGGPDALTVQPVLPERFGDRVFAAVRDEILRAAAHPPAVIVGRGAQCLLRNRDDALHVRLYAPERERVARVAARRHENEDTARDNLRRLDAARKRFLADRFGCADDEATLYDVQFNTARVPVAEAAAQISALLRARASPASPARPG